MSKPTRVSERGKSAGTKIEWTDVPSHPGYVVTITGLICGPSGKTLRPMVAESGHLYVITGNRRKLWVHHAVLLAFVGPRPDGQECRHLDGDPANNTLVNLAWGTRLQNALDQQRHGVIRRGEAKPNAKLIGEQVEAIRQDQRPARQVGRDYGVSHTTVLKIRRGEKWAAWLI